MFTNPTDLKMTKSDLISASATAAELKAAIEEYYKEGTGIGSNIAVNMTWFDANGTETTNQTEAVMSVYYIKVLKLITGKSVSAITVLKTTTKATITVELPDKV